MIDFPFQTYLFIYSLCTTPEFSEKQNKHYLKFCCVLLFFFTLKGELIVAFLVLFGIHLYTPKPVLFYCYFENW